MITNQFAPITDGAPTPVVAVGKCTTYRYLEILHVAVQESEHARV